MNNKTENIDSASPEHLRMMEALLFAAEAPLDKARIAQRMPDDADIPALLAALRTAYDGRGIELVCLGGKWMFRTARDLRFLLRRKEDTPRKLSRAARETLAIIAYHQPATRAEIEEIRGVGVSAGTLEMLMEADWVCIKGRRRSPGRPVTYGVSDAFLVHFGLESLEDLPGMDELKSAGLLRAEPPANATLDDETDIPDDDDIASSDDVMPDEVAPTGGDCMA